MSRAPGTILAHYDSLEPIGKGGTGEPYRPRNGKLDQDGGLASRVCGERRTHSRLIAALLLGVASAPLRILGAT